MVGKTARVPLEQATGLSQTAGTGQTDELLQDNWVSLGCEEIDIIPSTFPTKMPLPRETESLKASSFTPDRQYALSER